MTILSTTMFFTKLITRHRSSFKLSDAQISGALWQGLTFQMIYQCSTHDLHFIAPSLTDKAKTALQGIHVFLKVVERSTDAFPLLKSLVAAINAIVHLQETVAGNREEIEHQLEELRAISGLLAQRVEYGVWPGIPSLDEITEKLDQARATLEDLSSHGTMNQYAKNAEFTDKIRLCCRDITETLSQFQLALGIQQERMTLDIYKEAILGRLETSKDAPYTSATGGDVERHGCTPGTRHDVLTEILHWARSPEPAPSLFWLYGLAGIGKTAIAFTLCKGLKDDGLLASSYFCSIQLDSRNSRFIVPTIARHLASMSHAFAIELVSQLQADPDIAQATLQIQLDGLLCTPWKSSGSIRATLPPRPLVVVIDALDECDRGIEFLSHLLDAVDSGELQGLRFCVTSRPVPKLVEKWEGKVAQGHQIALHDVDRHLVDKDIRLYLQSKLCEPGSASVDADLDSLVSASGGLFIFASTVVKYVLSSDFELMQYEKTERLHSILSQAPATVEGINALYSRIINMALPQRERPAHHEMNVFKKRLATLHTIISLAEPQSAEVIAELVGVDVAIVRFTVRALHSVLYTATDGRIHTFHASFHDFIIDQERSSYLHCNIASTNFSLAMKCLRTVRDRLKFNICHLESSFTPDDELDPPLDQRISEHVGPLLAYSCQHWWTHWKRCDEVSRQRLYSSIHTLLTEKGIFWIEVMSLLDHIQTCKSILQENATLVADNQNTLYIPSLANEAADLVSIFISIPPPRITSHLYLSILSTWRETLVLEPWRSQFFRLPRVLQQQLDGRQHCQRVFNASSEVSCVIFSPDSKLVAIGLGDCTVRIWKVESGEETRRLEGHSRNVDSVAFSPAGENVASGSADKTVRMWDVESGHENYRLDGHTDEVRSVSYSPDGRQVASSSNDCTIRIWDVESGKEVHCLEGHKHYIWSVAYSPDSKNVASGSADKTVCIWDIEHGEQIHRLEGHIGWVESVSYSLDGRKVASGSDDGTVRIWDVESGQEIHSFASHAGWVESVSYSPNGKQVASGILNKLVCIWDVPSGKETRRLEGHTGEVRSVSYSPDGRQLASGSHDKTIRIWDMEYGEDTHRLEGHSSWVRSVAYSLNGTQVVSGSDDSTVRIWDVVSGGEIHRLEGHTDYVWSVAYSPDGRHVASGSDDKTIRIWNVESGEELHRIEEHTGHVRSVAYSPDGKQVVSGSVDKTVRIWDVKSGQEIHRFEGHTGWVESVAYSPNGRQVTSGSNDKTIRFWDLESGEEIQRLEGHTHYIWSVAYSPNGMQVASGSDDHTIRIWDVESGEEIRRLEGHSRSVQSVAFSPDSKHVASGSADKTIRIWDIESGLEIHHLEGHIDEVRSVAYSPDSSKLASSSDDETVRIWDVEADKEVRLVKGLTSLFCSVVFLPDVKEVVRSSDDQDILTWDYTHRYLPFFATAILNLISVYSLPPSALVLKPTGDCYYTRDDGWVVTSKGRTGQEEKLLWLPPSLRPFYPPLLQAISRIGFNRIDLTDCVFGIGWTQCYDGKGEAI